VLAGNSDYGCCNRVGVFYVLNPEEVSIDQLLNDLRQVKLPKQQRARLTQARVSFQAHGDLPTSVVVDLRALYRRHAKSIEKVYEARERARISMAKKRMGLSDDDLRERREERISGLRAQVEDLGF